MASDSLMSLTTNVPDWLNRLDELNNQIEQRQIELARVDPATKKSPSLRSSSLKNRGSAESLKPPGEGAAILPDGNPPIDSIFPITSDEVSPQPNANGTTKPSSPVVVNPLAVTEPVDAALNQTAELQTNAQRRARAVVRKRVKADSMISAEGAMPKFRTRQMVIVYYDSWVQSFFEELVKFVSASRNLMRKAKMAAKVAHIKRLAELEMPDDDDDSSDESDELRPGDGPIRADPQLSGRKNGGGMEELRLRYMSTRGMGPPPTLMSMRGGPGSRLGSTSLLGGSMGLQKDDIYDELDKGLDFVQGMCEHAAHQFLRDGDCAGEVDKIRDRLAKTRDIADKEMGRLAKEEDTNGLGELSPITKPRSFHPIGMRKEPYISRTKKPINSGVLDLEVDDEEDSQNKEEDTSSKPPQQQQQSGQKESQRQPQQQRQQMAEQQHEKEQLQEPKKQQNGQQTGQEKRPTEGPPSLLMDVPVGYPEAPKSTAQNKGVLT